MFKAPLGRSRQPENYTAAGQLQESVCAVHGCNTMQACGSVCADIQNHCGELIGNFQCERFVDETGSVFWSGQLFLKGVQTEAVVDTLI